MMTVRMLFHPMLALVGMTLGMTMATVPGYAANAPQTRLVHCGTETCLRISGHRPHATVAVRIAGRDVAVQGARDWKLIVSLATARRWATPAGDALTLTLADTEAMTERVLEVALPPGALGRQVELATLMVRAY